jgi:hypothetical protein
MAIFGAILIVVGLFFCLTIVGAVFGIPMILIGIICVVVGMMRRRTVITNVVQVSNVPGQQSWAPQNQDTSRPEPMFDHPKMITANPVPQKPNVRPVTAESYDRAKWDALVSYDDDIARVVDALQPFGQKYVDQLATAYLAINDKDYLAVICQKVVATAKSDSATANVTTLRSANSRR